MPQLNALSATTKTWNSQTNKQIFKRERERGRECWLSSQVVWLVGVWNGAASQSASWAWKCRRGLTWTCTWGSLSWDITYAILDASAEQSLCGVCLEVGPCSRRTGGKIPTMRTWGAAHSQRKAACIWSGLPFLLASPFYEGYSRTSPGDSCRNGPTCMLLGKVC